MSGRLLVVGMGASGVAAAQLGLRLGRSTVLADARPLDAWSPQAKALLERDGVEATEASFDELPVADIETVVISPGVPAFGGLSRFHEAGIEVISEIEYAMRAIPNLPVVAITGTNGKSTTTMLVGAMLEAAGRRVFMGGNLGTPPSTIAGPPEVEVSYDVAVLEISSFQAERIPRLQPSRAALLNVAPNHLDRYDGFEDYVAAKGNLFVNQAESDVAVVPVADERCRKQAERGQGRIITFGTASSGADVRYDSAIIRYSKLGLELRRDEIALDGDHNAANVCAALALLDEAVLEQHFDAIRKALASFEGLPHRVVRVADKDGVVFYDDSKATNVAAVVAAIDGLQAADRIVLIAGGRDKKGGYADLARAMSRRGRAAILIGEAADLIDDELGPVIKTVRAASMQEAVAAAFTEARPGDAVLLSPACSSFDMFASYAARGDAFREAVRKLLA